MDELEEKIDQQLENISTRQQLAELLELVVEDYELNLSFWNNQDLYSFIRAMSQYVKGTGGYSDYCSGQDANIPTWRLFAEIILAARAYVPE